MVDQKVSSRIGARAEQYRRTIGLEHQELSNAGKQQDWSTRS